MELGDLWIEFCDMNLDVVWLSLEGRRSLLGRGLTAILQQSCHDEFSIKGRHFCNHPTDDDMSDDESTAK